MLVVGILGSPRRGGNSEILLDACLDGARASGAEVRKLALPEMAISNCTSCGSCMASGRCSVEDDANAGYDLIDSADAVVISSPIWFDGPTSWTKSFMDRGQARWAAKYLLGRRREPRPALYLGVAGRERTGFECAERSCRTFLLCMDIALSRTLTFPGHDAPGSIRSHPSAVEDARLAGAELVREASG